MQINVISAVGAILMMLMVARGFVPLLSFGLARWVNWVLVGVISLLLTLAMRLIHWDMVAFAMGSDWENYRAMLGGKEFNAVFNVLTMIACFAMLRGRLLLIPEEDRHRWRWWSAWLHPRDSCIMRWRRKR